MKKSLPICFFILNFLFSACTPINQNGDLTPAESTFEKQREDASPQNIQPNSVNSSSQDTGNSQKINTPIKNFIEDYFKRKAKEEFLWSTYLSSMDLEINRNGNTLFLVENFNNTYGPNVWWSFADSHCNTNYLPRKEASLLEELDKELKEKFAIENLQVSYRSNKNDVKEVYRNHQYIYEDILLGLSPDGKVAELSFDFDGEKANFGLAYDMEKGKILDYTKNDQQFFCGFSTTCRGTFEGEAEFCQKAAEIARKKEHIEKSADLINAFFKEKIDFTDDIELYAKKVKYPSNGTENSTHESLLEYANMININLRHLPTQQELTLLTLNEPKCALDPFGFYGHPRMKGLIFIYVDSGCSWSNPQIKILGQDFLDQKLARFYNSVAMHFYQQKDYQQALQYFDKALAKDPKYAQAYFNKAATHANLKQNDSALKNLQKAIEFDSKTFKEKAKTDRDFQSLQSSQVFTNLVN